MSVYVGLDCGGSSTRALAVDDAGEVLFQGQSGAANLVSTPENRLRRNLQHATSGLPHADFVCGCFAGLVSEETARKAEQLLRELYPRAQVRAEPDYAAALKAAPPESDICVIAGTGSLVCSRVEGKLVRSGGRGFVLGDYGSGFQYGRDAVTHFLDSPDTASAALKDTLQTVFNTLDSGEIIASVYRGGATAMLLAKVSKALAVDARNGEAYALASIDSNTAKLAAIVADHAAKYHASQVHLFIALAGGVWKAAPMFKDQFEIHLRALLPSQSITVQRVNRPPLHGAVDLAKEMSHRN